MPFGIGFDILLALICGIHAVKTGRPHYWLMILFGVPILGPVAYILIEWLPESREGQRAMRRAHRAVDRAVNPGRAVREARSAVELAPTVVNRLRLAEALLDDGDAKGAVVEYRACLNGPNTRDLKLQLGLAQALIDAGEPQQAVDAMSAYRSENPGVASLPLETLYARALAGAGHPDAEQAFTRLLAETPDFEIKCHFAAWLAKQGQRARAQALYREVLATAKHWPRHTRRFNRQWLDRAEAGLRD